MTDHDVLAHERFRTIVAEPIEREAEEVYEGGASVDVDAVLSRILDTFPTAHFERTVNEHGVAVRRVHVVGEWEVDPDLDHPYHQARRAAAAAQSHDIFR